MHILDPDMWNIASHNELFPSAYQSELLQTRHGSHA